MTKRFDILIQGGLLVTGSGIRRADLGIRGEQIVSVEPDLLREEAGQSDRRLRKIRFSRDY